MEKPVAKKFAWVIKDFSSLQSDKFYSVPVLISGCKWRLCVFPKGQDGDHLSLYLHVVDSESLPCGWRRYVKFRFTIANKLLQKLSVMKETEHCFDGKSTTWGFPAMLSLFELREEDCGFLVNGEVTVYAELDVCEVIGTFDASESSADATELMSKKKENVGVEPNDLLKKNTAVKETNNANDTKQVQNAVKSSQKNKRWKIAFWIFVFLFIFALVLDLEKTKRELQIMKRNI